MRTLLVERRYMSAAMPTTDERPDAQAVPSRKKKPCRGPCPYPSARKRVRWRCGMRRSSWSDRETPRR
eukprot:2859899-Prymnesium_polylepis.1